MKLHLMELLVFVLTAAGIYCGWRYYHDIYLPEKQIQNALAEQHVLFEHIRPEILNTPGTEILTEPEAEVQEETETVPESVQFSESEISEELTENPLFSCEEVNPEAVGWIYIPGTNIDFPVMQGQDNEFYLHHGADGLENGELGCPFLDCHCKSDFSGLNSIVYAHNIENQAMFADIALYASEEFMQAHPDGYLVLKDGLHVIDFFAYLSVINTAPVYQTNPPSRQEYIYWLLASAKYSRETELDENAHLLLLSTCTFETELTRGILVGIIN